MVCIVIRLEVRCELRVLKVLTVIRAFLRMYMSFLEMKYVMMIREDSSDWTMVLLEVSEML